MMSLRVRSVTMAIGLSIIIPFALHAAAAPTADNAQREEVRKQLSSFFAQTGDKSPAGFSALQQSPATMAAVQKRIAGMSDQELAEFHQMMVDTPDWKNAPESLAKLLPPEMVKQVRATSADFTARVPKAEKMRDDARTLVTVLKTLPDEKLKELGVQRASIDALEQSLAQLNPLQTAVLQKDLADKGGDLKGAEALAALPPSLQKGAAALAKHGEITALDMVELEKFRASLGGILKRVQALPEESRKSLHIESLQANIDQVTAARPDVLFMMREQISPESLAKLDQNVTILEKAAKLTPGEQRQLENFRSELTDMFANVENDHADELRNKIGSLSSSELMILQNRMPDFENSKLVLPAYYEAIQSPDFAARMAAVKQATPDPAVVSSLENFRQQSLSFIAAAASDSSVKPELVAAAQAVMQKATLPQLEMIRAVNEKMPASASTAARLHTVTNLHFDCTFTIHTPDPLPNFDIDLSFICDPIASAITSVVDAINSTIDTVKAGLQSAIDAVTNTVNSLVNGIIDTVNTIWNFIQTIPSLAWNAIKSALNFLLDIDLGGGITLRILIQKGLSEAVPKLQQALNLTGSWWTALGQVELPQIPCPASGIHTPFGTVGSGDAVTKYNRYKFFIDKIIGLIPDTETSLEIKIPAQILYAAFDYLGVCLQDAANDANDQLLTDRFTSTQTNITTTTTLLGQQLSNSFNALMNLNNTQGASLTTLITTNTNMLSSQISNTTSSLTTLVTNKTQALTDLINSKTTAQHDLDLRMQIELNLQAGQGKALAAFELPTANGGYLELARDIVNNAISAMLAANQGVGQAQKWFTDAQANISAGKFKDAYTSLQKAYSELTK